MSCLFASTLLVCACALVCISLTPDIELPPECAEGNDTLLLLLGRAWPASLSVTAFLATLMCSFNGTLPELATPLAFARAPRFTFGGGAVQTNQLASRSIVLGQRAAVDHLRAGRPLPAHWRIGVVPLLFIDSAVSTTLQWQPLERGCAVRRSRHEQRHATLCAVAVGMQSSAALLTTMTSIDCDWALVYYGDAERHSLPLERARFLLHIPSALKSDLLVALAGLVREYATVMFTDEDIIFRSHSAQWEAELRCAFGHVPVVWRPLFEPHSQSIWPWMNADCFGDNVRAVAVGNFTFVEPQILFLRADFFVHYVDQFVVPVFVSHPELRAIWSLVAGVCLLAKSSFPDAVPCALLRSLTATHSDLRTLSKAGRHPEDAMKSLFNAMAHFPDTNHDLDRIDVVDMNSACLQPAAIGRVQLTPWRAPVRAPDASNQMLARRTSARRTLGARLCRPQLQEQHHKKEWKL
jgi:hypothetical protein